MRKFTLDKPALTKRLLKYLRFLNRNAVLLFVLVGGIMIFSVIRATGSAIESLPDQMTYLEEMAGFRKINFDEEVIQNIVTLVRNDVTINAELPEGRDNPFLDF